MTSESQSKLSAFAAFVGGLSIGLSVAAGLAVMLMDAGKHKRDTRTPIPVVPAQQLSLAVPAVPADKAQSAGFREYPIGEGERHHMRVSAVWLPAVEVDCHKPRAGDHVIHIEADIQALRNNPHGFGFGEWIPYLTVRYELTQAGEPVAKGQMSPMVAADGPHYGATIELPALGEYRLKYSIEPPSKAGFGRHSDALTGVKEWWPAFELEWSWSYQGSS